MDFLHVAWNVKTALLHCHVVQQSGEGCHRRSRRRHRRTEALTSSQGRFARRKWSRLVKPQEGMRSNVTSPSASRRTLEVMGKCACVQADSREE